MIRVDFYTYGRYTTDSLYQWDLNRTLEICGIGISCNPEVHFSNKCMDKAIVRQGILSGDVITVSIPNSLLQYDCPVVVWVGIYEGDTFKTIEKAQIPVIPRNRPVDYQIQGSDEEIYSFNEMENRVSNAELTMSMLKEETISEVTRITEEAVVKIPTTVDAELSAESTNVVQNKAITKAINNITSGTTPAGDSNKLGGHGAEYFAPLELVSFLSNNTKVLGSVTSLDGLNEYYGVNGAVNIDISGNYQTCIVLSGGKWWNLQFLTQKYANSPIKYRYSYYTNNAIAWSEWKEYFTTAGGTVKGNLTVSKSDESETKVIAQNSKGGISLRVGTNGTRGLMDEVTGNMLLYTDGTTQEFRGTATGNLPLTGGKLARNSIAPLELQNTGANESLLNFSNSTGQLGLLGFREKNKLVFYESGLTNWRELLHAGNSAKVHIGASAPSDTSALWIDTN